MKNNLNVFLAALSLMLGACSPNYYLPTTQNVPLIKARGESNIVVAGNANQVELQGAYGISDQLALQLNGGLIIPKNEDNGNGGEGKMIELGLGYFSNISDNFLFDVYALAGLGTLENHFPTTLPDNPGTTGKITAGLSRFGIQPGLSYHTPYFSVSASARLASLNYANVEGNLIFDGEDQVAYLEDNRSSFLIEPALTLRAGLERIKLQIQLMKSFNASNSDFKQDDTLLSIGLNFRL